MGSQLYLLGLVQGHSSPPPLTGILGRFTRPLEKTWCGLVNGNSPAASVRAHRETFVASEVAPPSGLPAGAAPSRRLHSLAGRRLKQEGKVLRESKVRGIPADPLEVFCVLCLPNAEYTGLVLVALLGSGAGAAQSRAGVSPLPPSGEKGAHISLHFLGVGLTHKQLSLLFL